MSDALRDRVLTAGRYLLGMAALAWVLSRGEWRESAAALAGVGASTVALLLALGVAGLGFRALLWYALVDHETPIRFRVAAEIDLVVNFLNQLLPSRLSGRSVAPLVVSRRANIDLATGIGITGVNTALYGLTYGVVGAVGVALAATAVSGGVLALIALSTALYLGAGAVILVAGLNATLVDAVAERLVPVVDRLPIVGTAVAEGFERVPEFTEQSAAVFGRLLTSPSAVGVYLLGWIGSIAVFPAARVAVLFGAFGASFEPLLALPAVLVAAYSVTLLPLTPGGIGVTEATAAAVFVSLGVGYEVAATTILLDRLLGVYLPALLGWYPTVRGPPLTAESG